LSNCVFGQEDFAGHATVVFNSSDWLTPEVLQAQSHFRRKRFIFIETVFLVID
jgi:hypothetical protein